MGTELVHDSGDYALLLDKVAWKRPSGWSRSVRTCGARQAAGETVGFGCGFFVEKSGIGPVEGARVTVDTTGRSP